MSLRGKMRPMQRLWFLLFALVLGIAQAAEHADEVSPRWTDRAYDALVAHAKQHTFFTVEQVRMAVAGKLPDPPTSRAWGSVVVRAKRAGIIAHAGHTEATDPAVHCNLVTLWRSMLRAPDPGTVPKTLEALMAGFRRSANGNAMLSCIRSDGRAEAYRDCADQLAAYLKVRA